MIYSIEQVTEKIKYINHTYCIDVTLECQVAWGEELVANAYIALNLQSISYGKIIQYIVFEKEEEEQAYYTQCIEKIGVGEFFQEIVNTVFEREDRLNICCSEGIDGVDIEFTNGRAMSVSNSEWGEIFFNKRIG